MPSADRFDQAAAFPELVELRESVRVADWTAIELFFAGLSDPDMTVHAAKVVADVTGAEEFLAQLPPSPLAHRLLAARQRHVNTLTFQRTQQFALAQALAFLL